MDPFEGSISSTPASRIEMAKPTTLTRTSSLNLTADHEEELSRLRKLKTESNNKLSQLNTKSSVQDFISLKTDSLAAEIAYKSKSRELYRKALQKGTMTQDIYKDAIESLDSIEEERELVQIKRQMKMFLEDLEEMRSKYESVANAYTTLIAQKMMSASIKQPKTKQSNQASFKAAVLNYYNAGNQDEEKAYCHVLGWIRKDDIKAAHIVPQSLGGDEVSHLFGYSADIASDPQNGLTLHKGIEEGLDAGKLVIVPEKKDQEIIWKIVVVLKNDLLELEYSDMRTWKEIDGKELVFLSENRPARRFLYLRFVITYLKCQKERQLDWINKIKANGHIWAAPGPYLRKSMLIELSRRVSYVSLPEAFYIQTTFENVDEESKLTEDEEKTLAMSLKAKIREEEEASKERAESDDASSDDEESEY